jgi:Ca2+-binding RTX toxin-like protein
VDLTIVNGTANGSGGNAQGDVLLNIENLTGSAFADNLTGDNGNNVINGGAGADVINGGLGIDTVDYSTSSAAVTVDLKLTTAQLGVGDAQGDQLSNIERVIGSANDDSLTGFAGIANYLDGGSGNDTLTGGTVNDTLIGGAGNDTFKGSAGADRIYGGTIIAANGSDTVDYSASSAAVTVDLKLTTAQLGVGDAQGDILSNISNLVGSAFDDRLTGLASGSKLVAGDGKDLLTGGAAADIFDLAAGNSSLSGDKAIGNSGADTFIIDAANLTSIDSNTLIQGTSTGQDTLQIKAMATVTLIDLTSLSGSAFTSINILDVSTNIAATQVKLNLATIQGLVDSASTTAPILTIRLGTDDTVSFDDGSTANHIRVGNNIYISSSTGSDPIAQISLIYI